MRVTDEKDTPPDVDSHGRPRLIPDPDEVKPTGWDDEDETRRPAVSD